MESEEEISEAPFDDIWDVNLNAPVDDIFEEIDVRTDADTLEATIASTDAALHAITLNATTDAAEEAILSYTG